MFGLKPRQIRVQSLKNQAVIADKCNVAESFFTRLRGLIGTRSLATGQGVFFPRNNSIHMWFMSIPIDVIFVKRLSENTVRVTSVHENLRPWKWLPVMDGKATDTLELPVGTIARLRIDEGDQLCID